MLILACFQAVLHCFSDAVPARLTSDTRGTLAHQMAGISPRDDFFSRRNWMDWCSGAGTQDERDDFSAGADGARAGASNASCWLAGSCVGEEGAADAELHVGEPGSPITTGRGDTHPSRPGYNLLTQGGNVAIGAAAAAHDSVSLWQRLDHGHPVFAAYEASIAPETAGFDDDAKKAAPLRSAGEAWAGPAPASPGGTAAGNSDVDRSPQRGTASPLRGQDPLPGEAGFASALEGGYRFDTDTGTWRVPDSEDSVNSRMPAKRALDYGDADGVPSRKGLFSRMRSGSGSGPGRGATVPPSKDSAGTAIPSEDDNGQLALTSAQYGAWPPSGARMEARTSGQTNLAGGRPPILPGGGLQQPGHVAERQHSSQRPQHTVERTSSRASNGSRGSQGSSGSRRSGFRRFLSRSASGLAPSQADE